MQIKVTSSVLQAMQNAAQSAYPNEACGILLGEGQCITAFQSTQNVHPTPQSHFEIDPQALIDAHRQVRDGGLQVIGYFHSHPNGDAVPSVTDRALSAGDGAIWAIVAGKQVRFWRDSTDGFTTLSYAPFET